MANNVIGISFKHRSNNSSNTTLDITKNHTGRYLGFSVHKLAEPVIINDDKPNNLSDLPITQHSNKRKIYPDDTHPNLSSPKQGRQASSYSVAAQNNSRSLANVTTNELPVIPDDFDIYSEVFHLEKTLGYVIPTCVTINVQDFFKLLAKEQLAGTDVTLTSDDALLDFKTINIGDLDFLLMPKSITTKNSLKITSFSGKYLNTKLIASNVNLEYCINLLALPIIETKNLVLSNMLSLSNITRVTTNLNTLYLEKTCKINQFYPELTTNSLEIHSVTCNNIQNIPIDVTERVIIVNSSNLFFTKIKKLHSLKIQNSHGLFLKNFLEIKNTLGIISSFINSNNGIVTDNSINIDCFSVDFISNIIAKKILIDNSSDVAQALHVYAKNAKTRDNSTEIQLKRTLINKEQSQKLEDSINTTTKKKLTISFIEQQEYYKFKNLREAIFHLYKIDNKEDRTLDMQRFINSLSSEAQKLALNFINSLIVHTDLITDNLSSNYFIQNESYQEIMDILHLLKADNLILRQAISYILKSIPETKFLFIISLFKLSILKELNTTTNIDKYKILNIANKCFKHHVFSKYICYCIERDTTVSSYEEKENYYFILLYRLALAYGLDKNAIILKQIVGEANNNLISAQTFISVMNNIKSIINNENTFNKYILQTDYIFYTMLKQSKVTSQ